MAPENIIENNMDEPILSKRGQLALQEMQEKHGDKRGRKVFFRLLDAGLLPKEYYGRQREKQL